MGKRKDRCSGDLELRRERLTELIEKLDLRYEELATLTEYSMSSISRMVRGDKDISDINIAQIIDNLNPKKITQTIEEIRSIKAKGIDKISLDQKIFFKSLRNYDYAPAKP